MVKWAVIAAVCLAHLEDKLAQFDSVMASIANGKLPPRIDIKNKTKAIEDENICASKPFC